jgi:hypothetical protein
MICCELRACVMATIPRLLLIALTTPLASATAAPAHRPDISHERYALGSSTVWHRDSEQFAAFRIPALAVLNSTIFAFAEGRVWQGRDRAIPCAGSRNSSCCYGALANCCDNLCVDKDIVVKHSTDGGMSWSPSRRLTASSPLHIYTNPTALTDTATERVWLLYQRCNTTARVPYAACTNVLRWTDSTLRWSLEIFPSGGSTPYSSVMGPGGGIQLRHRAHAGRLFFQGYHCLFSDDHGENWRWGGQSGVGESGAAELADGSIVLGGGEPPNHNDPYFHLSTDGGLSFAKQVHDGSVTDDAMQLSLLAVDGGRSVLLSSVLFPSFRFRYA